MSRRLVMDAKAVALAVEQMADKVCERKEDAPWALVGIRRGGEPLARRLQEALRKRIETEVPLGMVDITLYRDDGFGPNEWPAVGETKMPFELRAHTVVLVDDVLFTGRTVRAAMDAILDYGRPRSVRLVVLVDRKLRELPICPDAVGMCLETQQKDHVSVELVEAGASEDAVYVDTP